MAARILVVDDEPVVADTLALIFRGSGYVADAVYSGQEALNFISDNPPALVVTDILMPGLDGVELAKRIRRAIPHCLILLFSGNVNAQGILDAAQKEGHAFEVLAKPVYPPEILTKVASLLRLQAAEA